MSLGLAFWVLMFIWLILGLFWAWPGSAQTPYHAYLPMGGTILLFVLFLLLGWHDFGPPLHN
jgi:hypothetical protein